MGYAIGAGIERICHDLMVLLSSRGVYITSLLTLHDDLGALCTRALTQLPVGCTWAGYEQLRVATASTRCPDGERSHLA